MKQKILITGYDFPPQIGGIASYTHQLAKSLSQIDDLEVLVVARNQKDIDDFDKNQKYQINRINLPAAAILSYPFYALQLKNIIKKWQPTAIINPLWFPDAAATTLALGNSKIPYFIAVHGLEIIEFNNFIKQKIRSRVLARIKKMTFDSAHKIFPVSNYTKKQLINLYPDLQAKTVVINNGVDLDTFRVLKKNQLIINKYQLNDSKVLLSVCRLQKHKGIDLVIKALHRIVKKSSKIKYFIIGDGPDKERLKRLVDQYSLKDFVFFLGKTHIDTVVDFYNIADLFVLPSREELPNVEGFGLVFLEAAACGTPSIAGDSGGIPDAVEHLKTGWLTDPNSAQKLADLIEHLLAHPEHIAEVAKTAHDLSLRKSWQHVAKKLIGELFA